MREIFRHQQHLRKVVVVVEEDTQNKTSCHPWLPPLLRWEGRREGRGGEPMRAPSCLALPCLAFFIVLHTHHHVVSC